MALSMRDKVLTALTACWNDPVLKAKVQEHKGQTFIRVLDLTDFIAETYGDDELTVLLVEAVLQDLEMGSTTRKGWGLCVGLDLKVVAEKSDKDRHGSPVEGGRLKPKRERKGIWG